LGGEHLSVPDYNCCCYLDGAWIPHRGTYKGDWLVSLNRNKCTKIFKTSV
jgi:hypothetical protein